MKKTGYPPEYAGAQEALASTGGQLMPPVMGIAAFVAPFLRKNTRPSRQMVRPMFDDLGKQAAQVAIPIAAIGIIIAVAIQSNLAIKFSTRLMEISGGTLLGAMIFIIIGCIIMGMGIPTVAAYISVRSSSSPPCASWESPSWLPTCSSCTTASSP